MKHKIDYCDHCKTHIIICGECKMNTCSGSYGPWARHFRGGDNIPECKSCPEAYQLGDSLHLLLDKTNLEELITTRNNTINK